MASAGDRESLSTDVVIVGAGPSGLAAAIRIKQKYPDLGVTVVEKAAEIGGHILSGAVMDPKGLDALIPDWRSQGAPVGPAVSEDRFHLLTKNSAIPLPNLIIPPLMQTPDGVIVSLGDLCRWLGEQATALGVEIYPMTAAVDVVTGDRNEVLGIITGDLGVDRHGNPKASYAQGIALLAKYTLVAEGARGSLAKKIIPAFGLDAGKSPQKYGLGIKEVWEIPADKHREGRADHFLGYPLDDATGGGGFCYHAENRRIYLGLVVHLDYENPTLSPFEEFQKFKKHKAIAPLLAGARRISYGARTMTSGGWQSIPDLAFPGGALIGCAAGFMNAPRLKAIHNAILSGMAAGEAVGAAVAAGRANDWLETLQDQVFATGIEAELKPVRNMKPLWSRFGTLVGGLMLAGFDLWTNQLFKTSLFGTLPHKSPDFAALRREDERKINEYERPDGVTTFDRAASVFLANLSHDEDQPIHLVLADPQVPIRDNLPRYGEPAPLYCPAGVYELAEDGSGPVFRIHAANCVHCKTCDIKDPAQNITWVPPEGGSGPNYSGM